MMEDGEAVLATLYPQFHPRFQSHPCNPRLYSFVTFVDLV